MTTILTAIGASSILISVCEVLAIWFFFRKYLRRAERNAQLKRRLGLEA